MDDTQRTERALAVTAVAVIHVLLGWLLLSAGVVTIPNAPVAGTDDALQVTWIARLPSALPPTRTTAAPDARDRRPSTSTRTQAPTSRDPSSTIAPPAPVRAIDDATAAPTDSADAPLSATLIEHDRPGAEQPPGHVDFAPSPLRNRVVTLPGREANRFRMRDPVTPASVVESIGRLFGGGPSDPCPRLRDNIADMSTAGDSAALREAMERRASHCP